MKLPPAPTVATTGRIVVVQLARGLDLEVLALEFVTAARILAKGREVASVPVSNC